MNNKSYLLKYAVDYLSKYSSSKKNLERILKSKILRIGKDKHHKYQLFSNIPDVITILEKNKFISDEDFTQNKISLLAEQGRSRNYIYNFILRKGVDKKTIENQLYNYNNKNPEWEKKSAFIFAKKNKLLDEKKEIGKKLSKMARGGFSYELSMKILK